MTGDHKGHCCCVVDNGLFVEVAVKLAESFGKVYYSSPDISAFVRSNEIGIGEGFPGVTRILEDEIFRYVDDVDLFVFPDVYRPWLQLDLVARGKRVWGSRRGEDIEQDRPSAKQFFQKLGLSVGKYDVVTGVTALRKYLKQHPSTYVKISYTRGDMETRYAETYDLIEPWVDSLQHTLGLYKEQKQFVCEAAIQDAVEIGYDGYSVDGQFPNSACVGIEVKSRAYIGHFISRGTMPPQLNRINESCAPALEAFQYRNFFAVESRFTKDGTAWIVDPCCRQGSPPSEMLLEMYSNLDDIFWEGAEGRCIDPVPAGKCGAELILYSDWAEQEWQTIQFPAKIRNQVKLRNCCMVNGRYYVIPQVGKQTQIGAVVGIGDTLDAARKSCIEAADQIKGDKLDKSTVALQEAEEQIARLKEFGITL
jgi:hypothetical protein